MTKVLNPSARITLLSKLLGRLYDKEHAYQKSFMDGLIMQNSEYRGNDQPFMRLGKEVFFVGEKFSNPKQEVINLVHPEMRQEVKQHLAYRETVDKEKNQVTSYFLRMFQLTVYAHDFIRVLPTAMHHTVRQQDRHFHEGESGLSDEQLGAFVSENKSYLDMIKRRLTLNLLEL